MHAVSEKDAHSCFLSGLWVVGFELWVKNRLWQ